MFDLMRRRWAGACALVAVLFMVRAGYADSEGSWAKNEAYANSSLLISGRELSRRLNEPGIRILDVRPAEQYAAGHIPGALNLTTAEITRSLNGVPDMLAPVDVIERVVGERGVVSGTQVVIYDDIGGINATRLFWALDYLGHPQVSVLQGGLRMWRQEGRPTSRDVPKAMTGRFRAAPRPDRLADKGWVQARLKDRSVVIVDARSPEEFSGAVPGRDVKRPGHIPGAVNVDWILNLTETEPRQFKRSTELGRLYREAGATPEKEIVVYCRTGVRASHTYFALRLLGYPRVRLYDGSYVEWSADLGLPVAR